MDRMGIFHHRVTCVRSRVQSTRSRCLLSSVCRNEVHAGPVTSLHPIPHLQPPTHPLTPFLSTMARLDRLQCTLEPSGSTARFLVNTHRVPFLRVHLIWPTTSIDFPSVIVIVVGYYYLHASICRISLIFETTCFIRGVGNPQMIKKKLIKGLLTHWLSLPVTE